MSLLKRSPNTERAHTGADAHKDIQGYYFNALHLKLDTCIKLYTSAKFMFFSRCAALSLNVYIDLKRPVRSFVLFSRISELRLG